MKNTIYVLCLSLFVCVSCSKEEQLQEDQSIDKNESQISERKPSKVDICHFAKSDNIWVVISIKGGTALTKHLKHGDVVLVDADGDGFVTEANECLPVDCDDTDHQLTDNCILSVTICDQVWMVENLDVDTYRDGTPIPQVTDPDEWSALTTGAWSYYANSTANGTVYGKLYNWYAVNDTRGLAPTGWHIPSDVEWTTLRDCLGGYEVAGGKMKSTGTIEAGTGLWHDPNYGATNSSGFTGLPGGNHSGFGPFRHVGYTGGWWSSTAEDGTSNAWDYFLGYGDVNLTRDNHYRGDGFSVRCVRD